MKHTVTGKQPNSKMCAVCGLENPGSMKAKFFNLENGEAAALFTPREQHQGYPDRLHGGFATAILDELIGRAVNTQGGEETWSVTVGIKVKFRKPVPLGRQLKAFGRITKNAGRVLEGTGEILLEDGTVAVEAEARYMKVPFDTSAAGELGWNVIPEEDDPQEIELP